MSSLAKRLADLSALDMLQWGARSTQLLAGATSQHQDTNALNSVLIVFCVVNMLTAA